MRWMIAIALASCGGSQAPPHAPANTAPATPVVTRYCPQLFWLGPWHSELFPACPPPDIDVSLAVCAGACPRPCGASFTAPSTGPNAHRIERDARGRWIATILEHSEGRCSYRDDKLDACDWFHEPMHAERDARGRLIAVVMGDRRTPIAYDALGRVATVDTETFRYDARGYLVAVGDLALDVDARGRVISATPPPSPNRRDGNSEITTYRYDGDRLVSVDTPTRSEHATVDYDPRGRVSKVTRSRLEAHSTLELVYDDCR
jgi:YD repeat-containing protein